MRACYLVGPLVRIKQAMTKLKNECVQMELRIGVVSNASHGYNRQHLPLQVEHTLLMAALKHKDNMQMEMNSTLTDNTHY